VHRILFDFSYLFRPRWDTHITPPELMAYIHLHPPGRAIDLGCGTGTNVITLARFGWRAVGVDFSKVAIHRARRRIARAGIAAELIVANVLEPLPLREENDLALDIGCFHTLPDREPYLRNLSRLLCAGGHWLMYGFLRDSAASRPMGVAEEDVDLIESWGFDLLERQVGRDRRRHSGWFLFERSRAPRPDRVPLPPTS
jgi:SAM-dependent methyltransferase